MRVSNASSYKPVTKVAPPSMAAPPQSDPRPSRTTGGAYFLDTSQTMSQVSSKRPAAPIESVPLPLAAPTNPITAGEAIRKKPVTTAVLEEKEVKPDTARRISEVKDVVVKVPSAPVEGQVRLGSEEMEKMFGKVLESKLEAAKKEIMVMVREEQRNLHVEMIRQFEIQKESLSQLVEQKTQENNLHLLEIARLREELALIRRSQV